MEKSNKQYFEELDRNITKEYKNFQKRYNKYDKIDKKNYDTIRIDNKYYYNDDTYNLINKDLDKLNKILDKKHIKQDVILGIKKLVKTSSDGGLEWYEYYKMNYPQLINNINSLTSYLTNILVNRMTQTEYEIYKKQKERYEKQKNNNNKFKKRIL